MAEPKGKEAELIRDTFIEACNRLHGTTYTPSSTKPSEPTDLLFDGSPGSEPLKVQLTRAVGDRESEFRHPAEVTRWVIDRLQSHLRAIKLARVRRLDQRRPSPADHGREAPSVRAAVGNDLSLPRAAGTSPFNGPAPARRPLRPSGLPGDRGFRLGSGRVPGGRRSADLDHLELDGWSVHRRRRETGSDLAER